MQQQLTFLLTLLRDGSRSPPISLPSSVATTTFLLTLLRDGSRFPFPSILCWQDTHYEVTDRCPTTDDACTELLTVQRGAEHGRHGRCPTGCYSTTSSWDKKCGMLWASKVEFGSWGEAARCVREAQGGNPPTSVHYVEEPTLLIAGQVKQTQQIPNASSTCAVQFSPCDCFN